MRLGVSKYTCSCLFWYIGLKNIRAWERSTDESACLACMVVYLRSVPSTTWIVIDSSHHDPSAEEVAWEVQDHLLIPTEFKASLGYVRPAQKIFKNNFSFMAILRYYWISG